MYALEILLLTYLLTYLHDCRSNNLVLGERLTVDFKIVIVF